MQFSAQPSLFSLLYRLKDSGERYALQQSPSRSFCLALTGACVNRWITIAVNDGGGLLAR
jgi:hypothetical protein